MSFLGAGPNGTKIRDIAAAAHVNEALIYRHFASKQELFEAAIVEPLIKLMDQLQSEARSMPAGTEDQLVSFTRDFYRSLLRTFSETIDLFGTVLFSDRGVGRDFYATHLVPFIDSVVETVHSNLNSWDHEDFNPRIITTMGVGMCWGLAMDSYFREEELDIQFTAEAIMDVVFKGLLKR
ncbi:TetR/AcrR family transcriptional regulator [Brevibacterium sp. UCMA 11754]|nr:TetR/AcrR family transcriptional regulator [Brevibacterium sp. UCMA 11754]